jgi:phosphate transport system protein
MGDIDVIEARLQRLFGYVADGLERATDAFVREDLWLAASLVAGDPDTAALLQEVESLTEALLLDRSELSDDEVRLLVSVLRVAPELERSADLIENIALRTGSLTFGLPDDSRRLIASMGRYTTAMWRTVRDAWIARDPSALEELRACDDTVDELRVILTQHLARLPLTTSEAIELSLVARFFERLGDHAVSVTRRLEFLAPSLVGV